MQLNETVEINLFSMFRLIYYRASLQNLQYFTIYASTV